jgi:hypothetical protein
MRHTPYTLFSLQLAQGAVTVTVTPPNRLVGDGYGAERGAGDSIVEPE